MSGALAPIRPKLAALMPRLASEFDGEVVATARAIGRVLKGAGLDFHALAECVASGAAPAVTTGQWWKNTPPPAPRAAKARKPPSDVPSYYTLPLSRRRAWLDAVRAAPWLSDWEKDFADEMGRIAYSAPHTCLSTKQLRAINRLLKRAHAMGVRP